ncbi:MAG: DUF3833 domain-containing protein [Gemmobacter sp.]
MTPALMFLFGALLTLALVAAHARWLGFRAQETREWKGRGPDFDLRKHLSGPILCEGVIYGPTGRVTSRFVADMDGQWDGNRGVLAERFRYDNGAVQNRAWRLTLSNDGAIRAEADDVIGAGTGRQEGAAVRLDYRIRLPEESGGHVLAVTDWMYLMENGTIMNRSQFRKWGIKVAELVATMRRKDAA